MDSIKYAIKTILGPTWQRILPGIWIPIADPWKRFIHWLTNGNKYPHSLEGGGCPLCGANYQYPGWYHRNQTPDKKVCGIN